MVPVRGISQPASPKLTLPTAVVDSLILASQQRDYYRQVIPLMQTQLTASQHADSSCRWENAVLGRYINRLERTSAIDSTLLDGKQREIKQLRFQRTGISITAALIILLILL